MALSSGVRKKDSPTVLTYGFREHILVASEDNMNTKNRYRVSRYDVSAMTMWLTAEERDEMRDDGFSVTLCSD